jgi:hypothetical protein
MKNSFKHSGTLGDLIYSLPVVKHYGGGDFYLHMHQIDYLSQTFYGVPAPAFHAGRMNQKDFEFIRTFMEAQSYISKFAPLDVKTTEITHNLDKFRPLFIKHPGNYVDVYAMAFGIMDVLTHTKLRQTPWIDVPTPISLEKDIVINRTLRWIPPKLSSVWKDWEQQGVPDRAVFLGLPEEHAAFNQATGWNVAYQPVNDLLHMAQLIAGAGVFIGNQSVALSLAIGMGHNDIWCEGRRDLPIERNECYFKEQHGLHYF